jgi:two-component system phosphate regulon response regulator PhoB
MALILVIDDDEIAAGIAAEALISAGHGCGCVPDVDAARDLLRWRRPDLLLLDHDMPGTTGGCFLRELRNSPDTYDLPVVMFTRIEGADDESTARYNGAQDYVRKPFDKTLLVWRVNKLLEARAHRPQHRDLPQVMRFREVRAAPTGPRHRRV